MEYSVTEISGIDYLEGVMITTTSNAIGKAKIREDLVVITINLVVSIKAVKTETRSQKILIAPLKSLLLRS